MNKFILYTACALTAAAALTGCRSEEYFSDGEGKVMLQPSILSDVRVKHSRGLSDEENRRLSESAKIWISSPSKGALYKYEGISQFPAEGLPMVNGRYVAEGWYGDSVSASWDKKIFYGRTEFDVNNNLVNVALKCPILNTLASVTFTDEAKKVIDESSVSFTVTLDDGLTGENAHALTFSGFTADKGYYMINSRTKGFLWTLKAKTVDGKEFTRSGEYKDADVPEAPGLLHTTEYVFRVSYTPTPETPIGGANLVINVIPEPVEGTEEEIVIALAPQVRGLDGLDISQPIVGAPGEFTRKSLYVTGAHPLTSVVIEGSLLTALGLEADYELRTLAPDHVATLRSAGLDFILYSHDDAGYPVRYNGTEAYNLRLNLGETALNRLSAGTYTLNLRATDTDERTSTTAVTFNISESPVQLTPISQDAVDYTSARLTARIVKPGATRYGFEVRKTSAGASRAFETWTFVEATIDGDQLTAPVTGLENGTTYEYCVIADSFRSPVATFTTRAYPQLPNAGFENWSKPSKAYLPWIDGTDLPFWDSGNHGSSTMNKNVTAPDETVTHSGRYSLKMASQFVGMFGVGKFAAGNIFIGKYLATDGTDGVLGFGRPWTAKPKALRGYVKYRPVPVTHDAPAQGINKGDLDNGIIYVALMSSAGEVTYGEDKFPVIVRTKTKEFFSKDAANVIAYGEKYFTSATEGEGMVEFYIPLTDVHPGTVAYISITASASKGGDFFAGGDGSTMWLDDLKLVY